MRRQSLRMAVLALLLSWTGPAMAQHITGSLWLNQGSAASNATLSQAGSLGTPDAMFDAGTFNFDSRVSGYTIGDFLNNPTFYNTSAAFDPSHSANNTYFYFTGSFYLNAGNNAFVVGHDDGLQLNVDSIGLVVNHPGPTAFTNTPFNVTASTAGLYNFEMSYGEVNGAPAVLLFTINGAPVGSVPEPSTLLGMGTGLVSMLGLIRLRRRAKA